MSIPSRILVVAGMHRSGTSLLASILAAAGVEMGAELMGPSRGNDRGHFEDLEIQRFQEACLARRGASALSLPAGGVAGFSAAEASQAARLIAARAAKPVWGWKDPRTCLFLLDWERLLAAPLYLLVYRHPVEVVLSLLRRGIDLDVQLDPATAIRAWTEHNRQILALCAAARERCVLWSIAGATRDLGAALSALARRSGLQLAGRGLEQLYAPEDLQQRLQAPGIDWHAVLPEAMGLYEQLEAAADLAAAQTARAAKDAAPAAAAEDPRRQREDELLEAGEHLLAAALRGAGGAASGAAGGQPGAAGGQPVVSARARIDFSELRLQVARQAERIAALERQHRHDQETTQQLAARAAALERLESTRAVRWVQAYWGAARRVRGWTRQSGWRLRQALGGAAALRPEEIVVGCVAENLPRYLAQARRLALSLRWFGGALAQARMLVCVVGDIRWRDRIALESAGAEVRVIAGFDHRNPPANKLGFFAEALAAGARGLLLLDCDTVVVGDPLPHLVGGALQAKIADVPSVSREAFARLFRHFGLPLPRQSYQTTLLDAPTILYCNSGVVFMTGELAREFVPVWREWNHRILDALDLLGPCAHHCHQASLSLALAAHPIPYAEATAALNFPLHMKPQPAPAVLLDTDPLILHYHDEIDAAGCLRPCPYPRAQARIEMLNQRLVAAKGEPILAG
jgi:hypothetical protein